MGRRRVDDPPVTMEERQPVTADERRARRMNKREYDRETQTMPSREQSRQEHATKSASPVGDSV